MFYHSYSESGLRAPLAKREQYKKATELLVGPVGEVRKHADA